MNDFTASNGISVANHGGNWDRTTIHFEGEVLGLPREHTMRRDVAFEDSDFTALREFFRAEEDERLGRWRWPENDEYVAYRWSINYINVLYLHDGISTEFRREDVDARRSRSFITDRERVARDWFDAHPEPKPWHDAKHGEIWVLFVAINEEAYRVDGDSFVPVNNPSRVRIKKEDPRIKRAHMIWPEVSA